MPNIPHSGTLNAVIKSPIITVDGRNQLPVSNLKLESVLQEVLVTLQDILKKLPEVK